MRLVNPGVKWLLRSPLHGVLSGKLLLLTLRGRRSGRRISTPVGYRREGDHYLVFTHSPWRRNLEGGAPVAVRVAGRKEQARAEVVQDAERLLDYLQGVLAQEGPAGALQLGVRVDRHRTPTREELRAAIRGLAMIQIVPVRSPERPASSSDRSSAAHPRTVR
jgi:hypothetical protein